MQQRVLVQHKVRGGTAQGDKSSSLVLRGRFSKREREREREREPSFDGRITSGRADLILVAQVSHSGIAALHSSSSRSERERERVVRGRKEVVGARKKEHGRDIDCSVHVVKSPLSSFRLLRLKSVRFDTLCRLTKSPSQGADGVRVPLTLGDLEGVKLNVSN